MTADATERRPGKGNDAQNDHSNGQPLFNHQQSPNAGGEFSHRITGCPCGCRTRLPWLDDPDCVRHQPIREPEQCANVEFVPDGVKLCCGDAA